jgi:hypothetical protein
MNNDSDRHIYSIIDAEIEAKTHRYNVLKNHKIIGSYDVRFAMYLDQKYLQYIFENLNDTNLKFSNKLTLLSLYFTQIYMNENIITHDDIISSLNIMINGKDLLPLLPSGYHNMVVPYMKGYSLPTGYHMYSFAINNDTTQPNGFITMKKLKDFLIYSKQKNINMEYKLKICTREYKILNINNMKGTIVS